MRVPGLLPRRSARAFRILFFLKICIKKYQKVGGQSGQQHRQSTAVDKIVDDINRRMGSPRSQAIRRASQGTSRTGKGWQMKIGRRSPDYTADWRQLPVANA
jgi:hypothetical protein